MKRTAIASLACVVLAFGALPIGADWRQAIADGETDVAFRYRLEHVDQDNLGKNATASTGKARLTFTSAANGRLTLGLEADYALILGIEDFNSTVNGKTEYPIVADPQGFDLNQAHLKYENDGLVVTAGRQRINHGRQRFLGGVAWRHNEQTYDALRVQRKVGRADFDYSYIHNVNRIFGPKGGVQPSDWHGNTHAARLSFAPSEGHALAAFGYLIDLQNDNGPPNANATFGVDYNGTLDRLSITAALAWQSDYADNPMSYDATFYSIQGAVDVGGATLTGGYDVLGSDGGQAGFRTPLATLHKWQGWTDKFLGTPATGVRDAWFSVSGKVLEATVTGVFHSFSAAEGSMDYGSEIGVSVVRPLSENLGLTFKWASYSADELATDTSKAWLMLSWQW